MDSAAAVRYARGRSTTRSLVLPRRLAHDARESQTGWHAADGSKAIRRAAFGKGSFDGPYTSYRNTLSRVHCYLCLLGGGGLYAGLYHVAVLMTSVHTVLNAATANTS